MLGCYCFYFVPMYEEDSGSSSLVAPTAVLIFPLYILVAYRFISLHFLHTIVQILNGYYFQCLLSLHVLHNNKVKTWLLFFSDVLKIKKLKSLISLIQKYSDLYLYLFFCFQRYHLLFCILYAHVYLDNHSLFTTHC